MTLRSTDIIIPEPKGFTLDPSCVLYLPLHKMEFGRSANLLTNPGFEIGDPPTGWTLAGTGATIARSGVQKHGGSYSALVTRNGTDCNFYRSYTDYPHYAGLTATLGGWVHASVADRARLIIWSGATTQYSSYHIGSGNWEKLTASVILPSGASNLVASGQVRTGDTSAYFDDFDMYINNLTMSRDHYGHPVQNSGAIWTFPYGYLFDGIDDIITIPDHTAIQNIFDSPGGTIIAWINATSAGEGSAGVIWSKGKHIGYLRNVSGETCAFRFYQYCATVSGYWTSANYVITYKKPQMVSVSYDNSLTTNDPVFCIDGNPITIVEDATPQGTRITDANFSLCIGNDVTTVSTHDGYIPEVIAYKGKMIQPPELRRIFLATKGRYGR